MTHFESEPLSGALELIFQKKLKLLSCATRLYEKFSFYIFEIVKENASIWGRYRDYLITFEFWLSISCLTSWSWGGVKIFVLTHKTHQIAGVCEISGKNINRMSGFHLRSKSFGIPGYMLTKHMNENWVVRDCFKDGNRELKDSERRGHRRPKETCSTIKFLPRIWLHFEALWRPPGQIMILGHI